MRYTPQTWLNGRLGETPINAERLAHMEDGIAAAANALAVIPSVLDFAGNDTQSDAFGDLGSRPLSGFFASLASAQSSYPHATSLDDELDWAILQMSINLGSGGLIPERESYHLNRKLSLINQSGIQLEGVAASNVYEPRTKLLWTGADGGIMVDMSGTLKCHLANIGFYANASVEGTATTTTAVRAIGNGFTVDGITTRGSLHNHVETLYFQNCGTCVDLGVEVDQVDTWVLERLWGYGGRNQIGFRNRSANSLINVVRDCNFGPVEAYLGGTTTARAILVESGSVAIENLNCNSNLYGLELRAPTLVVGNLIHTEGDGIPVYSPEAGANQKLGNVVINGLHITDPKVELLHLRNSDLDFYINGGQVVSAGAGVSNIVVPDVSDGVELRHFTYATDTTIKTAGGATRKIVGNHGIQTPSRRTSYIPEHPQFATTGTPTLALTAANGTGGPAPVLLAGSTDHHGRIAIGTGTGATAGNQISLTFSRSFTRTPVCVIVSDAAGAGHLANWCVETVDSTVVYFEARTDPPDDLPLGVLDFYYWIWE